MTKIFAAVRESIIGPEADVTFAQAAG